MGKCRAAAPFGLKITKLPIYQILVCSIAKFSPCLRVSVVDFFRMILGLHAILYSPDADKVRAFLRDVLGLKSVDAGHGWLIFAAPPAELAAHPTEGNENPHHELYLMCDDLKATMKELSD